MSAPKRDSLGLHTGVCWHLIFMDVLNWLILSRRIVWVFLDKCNKWHFDRLTNLFLMDPFVDNSEKTFQLPLNATKGELRLAKYHLEKSLRTNFF